MSHPEPLHLLYRVMPPKGLCNLPVYSGRDAIIRGQPPCQHAAPQRSENEQQTQCARPPRMA